MPDVMLRLDDDTVHISLAGTDLLAPLIDQAKGLVQQAEAARDAVRPLFGIGAPAAGIGGLGSVYYDTSDNLNPILYGPKTAQGWGVGRGLKGNPGGNAMAIGTFTNASGLLIPVGTDLVRTTGHTRPGMGAGFYIADPIVTAAFRDANPRWTFISANGRGFRLFEDTVMPDHAGAIARLAVQEVSGVASNDNEACKGITGYLNAGYGSTLTFRQDGTYHLLAQRPHPLGPQFSYLVPDNPFPIVRERLHIHWAGRFKSNPGLKLGSFNPQTGEPFIPNGEPFYDYSVRAEIGTMFHLTVRYLTETGNAVVDGNSFNMIVGGYWGDTGYQLDHTFKRYDSWYQITSNVAITVQDFLLDGIIAQWPGLTASNAFIRPSFVYGHSVNRVGRNCISGVGGIDLLFDFGHLQNPGMGYHSTGRLNSSPAACIDWEAEGSINLRCGTGRHLSMDQGPFGNTAWVADSGPSSDLYMHGRANGTLWTSKRRTVWDCEEHTGYIAKVLGDFSELGQVVPFEERTVLRNFHGSDQVKGEANPVPIESNYIDLSAAGRGVRFEGNCRIKLQRTKLLLHGADMRLGKLVVDYQGNTNFRPNGSEIVTVDGGYLDLVILDNVIRNDPATPAAWYTIYQNGTYRGYVEIVPPANAAATGYKVRYGGGAGAPSPENPALRKFSDEEYARSGWDVFVQNSSSDGFVNLPIPLTVAEAAVSTLTFTLENTSADATVPPYSLTWNRMDGTFMRLRIALTAAYNVTNLKVHWRVERIS